MITPEQKQQLIAAACTARENAYVPYSNYPVGAALLMADGAIVTGVNVENASYGLTICAERAAVFHAVAQGEKGFQAIGLCVPGAGAPCGACRQVLHEFAPAIKLFIADEKDETIHELELADLLPRAFGPGDLQGP